MNVLRDYYEKVNNYFANNADPRTTNWFLMASPFPVLAISMVYVILVQVSEIVLKAISVNLESKK